MHQPTNYSHSALQCAAKVNASKQTNQPINQPTNQPAGQSNKQANQLYTLRSSLSKPTEIDQNNCIRVSGTSV